MEGKKTLLLLVIFLSVVMGLLFLFHGYEKTWKLWGIPTLTPHFADTRVIVASAEARRMGYDPAFYNPTDPWKRTLNYPRVWEDIFFFLNARQSQTTFYGVLFIFLFFAGVFLFSGKIDNVTALFLFFGIFSPAVLFGMERANVDLLIFFILALALFSLRRSSIVSTLLVIMGTFLKLYPVFSLSCLLRENRRKFTLLAVTSFILISIYGALTFRDISLLFKVTPKDVNYSVGSGVMWRVVQGNLPNHHIIGTASHVLTWVALLFLGILAFRANRGSHQPLVNGEERYIDSFRMGSAIYIGLFLWGSNYDYKLMLLLFVIPQILLWARRMRPPVAAISRMTITAIMFSLWYLFVMRFTSFPRLSYWIIFLLDQLSKWTIFGGLLYLLVYLSYHSPVFLTIRKDS